MKSKLVKTDTGEYVTVNDRGRIYLDNEEKANIIKGCFKWIYNNNIIFV